MTSNRGKKHSHDPEPGSNGSRAQRRRPTIGFITANIHGGTGGTLWPGVIDAAEQHDANLICFPGGELRSTRNFEAQRNVIYDLAGIETLDGLVSWPSAVGLSPDQDEVANFYRDLLLLPIVHLTQPLGKNPTLLIDSYQGMREVVIHLIEVHGYRRMAFIRGPASHRYAQERYRAYVDTLQEYQIPLIPHLVSPPADFDPDAGAQAFRVLLDERRLRPQVDFEAVVVSSDALAFGVLQVVQARGIRIPGDIAITSFNDSQEGRLVTPPLTSVAMPFYEQGAQAVEVLMGQIAGVPAPDRVVLPSRLVVRQSCGCPSAFVAQTTAQPARPSAEPFETAIITRRAAILALLAQTLGAGAQANTWAGQLLDALAAELHAEAWGAFLRALEQILHQVVDSGGDLTPWDGAIATLRRALLPYLDPANRARTEYLWGQARLLIAETLRRVQAHRQLQAEQLSKQLQEIGHALITTFDVAKLMDALAARLPDIGIASCYLSLYENPEAPLEQARLVLAYNEQGRVALEPEGRRFPSRQLVPEGLLPRGRRWSMVVEALYFREEQIGFVMFEIGPRDGAVYEMLRVQISSALKGALLFREALEARNSAEKADRIKTRLLANVSHEFRTPLNIILGCTTDLLRSPNSYASSLPPDLLNDLHHIHYSAEHQLRLINDLLDLSRAEIDALDLYPELIDPRPLLADAFHSIADHLPAQNRVCWRLDLPERLPAIQADRLRLRQILLNLLSNAHKFTECGQVILGADVQPPQLHIWIENTGDTIPAELRERIFEPFVTGGLASGQPEGIGLGLAITQHLIALHGGSITLERPVGRGNVFRVYLPLPNLSDQPAFPQTNQPVLLLISAAEQPSTEVIELSRRQGLEIRRLQMDDDLEMVLAGVQPAALAWDLADARPGDWTLVRRLRNHPRVAQTPFILYGQNLAGAEPLGAGLTSYVVKPVNGGGLLDAINAICPTEAAGPILIVDDDPRVRELHRDVIAKGLPGYTIHIAEHGAAALELMAQEVPSVVLLDLMMPEMDGFDVLDRMRADPLTRHVPVLILSGRMLNLDDIKRLEPHAQVTLQSKGILSEAEMVGSLHRALFGTDRLPPHTSMLVKRTVAYLHQNYPRQLARWEIAEAIGVSEDYLSRVFHRELGLSPWEYLNRYRIHHAKELLRRTNDSIEVIGHQVGFRDRGYFSRVFRKLAGVAPNTFREHPEA